MGKIYIFYGEEKYDLEQRIEKIKKEFLNLELGINLFYITAENIGELENISTLTSFFGEEKLVIIKNMNLKFDTSILIENSTQSVTYIVVEDSLDKRTTQYKELSKVSEIVEFKFLDEAKMTTYIIQVLKKYNIAIDYNTANYMYSVCGENKTNIINELKKIVSYINNENGSVTKEIIDKVCVKTLNAKIFDMLDMIVNKKHIAGISMLEDLLLQKEPIVKIYVMLYKQIKQMYMIKILKSKNTQNIVDVLSMHPYTFQKLSKASENYKLDDLKKIIEMFDKYDETTKNGDMDFEVGLKKIICAI